MDTRRNVLRTALRDPLGIEHPIVQSGMGGVAGPDRVAEVSRAGGLASSPGSGSPVISSARRFAGCGS